jgi:hypothetical protein
MRFNAVFADLVGEESLRDGTGGELPGLFRLAVDDGWTVDERGAWLLLRFRDTYFGSPGNFTDVTGYESAMNGRAIPDLDLTVAGKTRAVALAQRGVAFVRAALHRLNMGHPDHPPTTAYVSISEVDRGDYDGSVTFVTAHAGEPPYLADLDGITANAVLAIDSTECLEPVN